MKKFDEQIKSCIEGFELSDYDRGKGWAKLNQGIKVKSNSLKLLYYTAAASVVAIVWLSINILNKQKFEKAAIIVAAPKKNISVVVNVPSKQPLQPPSMPVVSSNKKKVSNKIQNIRLNNSNVIYRVPVAETEEMKPENNIVRNIATLAKEAENKVLKHSASAQHNMGIAKISEEAYENIIEETMQPYRGKKKPGRFNEFMKSYGEQKEFVTEKASSKY